MTAQPYPAGYADELIGHADRLRRSTKAADYRRAVSAYYYATFHALGCAIAEYFPEPVQGSASRLINHGPIKQAGKFGSQKQTLDCHRGNPSCPAAIAQIAQDMAELQDSRQIADYRLGWLVTLQDANRSSHLAARVLVNLGMAKAVHPDELAAYLLYLVGARPF